MNKWQKKVLYLIHFICVNCQKIKYVTLKRFLTQNIYFLVTDHLFSIFLKFCFTYKNNFLNASIVRLNKDIFILKNDKKICLRSSQVFCSSLIDFQLDAWQLLWISKYAQNSNKYHRFGQNAEIKIASEKKRRGVFILCPNQRISFLNTKNAFKIIWMSSFLCTAFQ